MLSRLLSPAAMALLIGSFVPGTAAAQNLEAGKSPSQIFAGACAACHKSPRGLVRTVPPSSLPTFLRQHYTTGSDMASLLSSYLVSNGGTDTRYKQSDVPKAEVTPGAPEERQGRRPRREQEAKPEAGQQAAPGEEPKPRSRRGRRPAQAEEAKPAEAAPAASAEAPEEQAPKGRKLGRKGAKGHTEPAASAKPAETKSDETTAAKPAPAAETAKPAAEPAKDAGVPLRADPVPAVTPAPSRAGPPAETKPTEAKSTETKPSESKPEPNASEAAKSSGGSSAAPASAPDDTTPSPPVPISK